MRIKKLLLKNFRNYREETFEFSDGLNVLYGRNAQGKTNCAEAVFYLCTGTSPRAKKDRQMILSGEERAFVGAEAESRFGRVSIEAEIFESSREIRVNGIRIGKNADLLGNINGVFFSPAELRLVQDGPEERRRFLNVSISQMYKSYYTALIRYNKILEQRNALLKNRDLDLVFETLPVWDAQLCRYAAEIVERRAGYVAMLSPAAAKMHAYLTDGAEELEISSDRHYPQERAEIEKKLAEEFADNYERDVRLGFTASGPHRDDLKICIGGKEARVYASQGQARTAALSVKLAEAQIFRELSGEYPVLILDDVMSELDLARRRKLLSCVDGMQTILTCTHTEKVLFGKTVNKIRIVGGKIKR
ncbi:MAG TPA: DNA replication/repair protein RecF [Candidatus Borkfalkia excrementavium]|uniref:DNA replication and repair protein RecF n=1 Tax=Candidatus Borkfalkia excrementavium TaxID=2838505 RepID=A0A9D1ZB40_9FIRM|nr:DNA replication/repair protein RecF [Candidatus Borkfalkia excrementavium]